MASRLKRLRRRHVSSSNESTTGSPNPNDFGVEERGGAPEGTVYPLGDDIGFLRLVGTMPENDWPHHSWAPNHIAYWYKEFNEGRRMLPMDLSVVQAARVSFGQGSKGVEKDTKLIRYLMANGHGTPTEMATFKFHAKVPIYVMRQWIRHRMGSFNELSGRYTEFAEGEVHIPKVWRLKDTKNKQGSVVEMDKTEKWHSDLSYAAESFCKTAHSFYQILLGAGVAKEQARIVLPLNLYTELYWKVNARSLMNFLKLRMHPHAQLEVQQYAREIFKIFRREMPVTAQAFRETLSPDTVVPD